MKRRSASTKMCGLVIVVFLLVSLGGCARGQIPSATHALGPEDQTEPTPSAAPSPSAVPTSIPPPEHRIAVRVVDGVGEFFDRRTGERFVPRGNNYIRLAPMSTSSRDLWHSTLSPGYYDPDAAEAALQQMHADGYNTVRVFLDCCRDGNNIGDRQGGLSADYLDIVLDFLARAKANEMYVILDLSLTPADGGYNDPLWHSCTGMVQGDNCRYLTAGGIEAKRLFIHDVVEALMARSAPLDYVFAYGLENEMFFDTRNAPLTLTSGRVRAPNGETYDLASPTEQQRMMDDAIVHFIDTLRTEILALDPTALVTAGFFPPDRPNPWPSEPRRIRTYSAVWESTADFIDFHPYPGGYGLAELVENFEMTGAEAKPIIMGEYGAPRHAYSSAAGAAMALHDWQVESCEYGFDGWLLWTWDGHEQTDFYNGLSDGGLINQALAPINRPDPCEAGSFPFFERNIAQGRDVRTSRWLPEWPPQNAVNGNLGDLWGTGAFPVQWIEVDLGSPTAIRIVRLFVTQSPPGHTVHQIWVGADRGGLTLLHEFEGDTASGQMLEWRGENPVSNVRYVRVVTTQSPSWVAWNEIEVIGP